MIDKAGSEKTDQDYRREYLLRAVREFQFAAAEGHPNVRLDYIIKGLEFMCLAELSQKDPTP